MSHLRNTIRSVARPAGVSYCGRGKRLHFPALAHVKIFALRACRSGLARIRLFAVREAKHVSLRPMTQQPDPAAYGAVASALASRCPAACLSMALASSPGLDLPYPVRRDQPCGKHQHHEHAQRAVSAGRPRIAMELTKAAITQFFPIHERSLLRAQQPILLSPMHIRVCPLAQIVKSGALFRSPSALQC